MCLGLRHVSDRRLSRLIAPFLLLLLQSLPRSVGGERQARRHSVVQKADNKTRQRRQERRQRLCFGEPTMTSLTGGQGVIEALDTCANCSE
jgi:hypothetical protein